MSETRDHQGRPRVAVTGMGVKTPAGCDLDTFYSTVIRGVSVAGPIKSFNASAFPIDIACEVLDFDPRDYTDKKSLHRMDRVAQLGFAAAMDAYRDSGGPAGEPERCGVVLGTGMGGAHSMGEQAIVYDGGGPRRVSPLLITMLMPNAASALVAIELGWTGPNSAICTACAAGTSAIGEGTRLIQRGECDTVLAGGAEYGLSPFVVAAFLRTGALSSRTDAPERASRPFDVARDGYVMAEGAAFLVLERLDLAVARNARIYGEVLGYGSTNDAYHLASPRPGGVGAAEAMRRAIADAGLPPTAIGHVNAHGTSTRLNDAMESCALHVVFPAGVPPVTSCKGVLGHLMGAAGSAEAVIALLSARDGLVPPTANYETPDPECDIDVVHGSPRTIGRLPVISNSFGLGGNNASVVLAPISSAEESYTQID